MLSNSEVNFYERRSSIQGVLKIVFADLLSIPPEFSLLYLPNITAFGRSAIAKRKQKRLKDAHDATELANRLLVKTKQGALDGDQIVRTAFLNMAEKRNNNHKPADVVIAVDSLCSVSECDGVREYRCDD